MKIERVTFQVRALLFAVCVLASPAFAQEEKKEAPAPASPATPEAELTEKTVVITVDGSPITLGDIHETMMTQFADQLEQMPPAQRAALQPQIQQMVISNLISKTLLLNAANKKGIKANEDKIAENLAEIAKNLPEGAKIEEYAASAGVKMEDLRGRIADNLVIQQLVEEVSEKVEAPAETEVKKYYEEHPDEFEQQQSVSCSHILIDGQGVTDEAELAKLKEKADDIRKQLLEKKGENFAELAMAHSSCPSRAQGGDLGEFSRGQMVPTFEEAAFTQEVGAIGEPVKTQFGYHIIKVTDKKEAKKLTFDEVKEDLTEDMHESLRNEEIKVYVEELRDEADIQQTGGQPKPEGEEGAAKPEETKKAGASEEAKESKEEKPE